MVESSKGEIDPCSVDRQGDECIGGVTSPRRIRYGFINEQQAARAVAIAYLVVSIWKEWEQETESDMDGGREGEEEKRAEKKTDGEQSVQPPRLYVYVVVWQGLSCQLSTE